MQTSIRELVEERKHDRQQLLEINEKLENIMKNVDHLDGVLKNQQKEIELLRQELKPAKAEQSTLEVKLQKQPDHQDEGKIKHQPEIKSENVQQKHARDNFGTQEDFVTILEDDSEASEQMEERRRRRVSAQPQIEPVERERIDSGVSVTSVDGLLLSSEIDSGGVDSCSPNMESSSSELPEMYSSLSGSLAVMERPFVDQDKTPVCTPTASPIPQRKTKNC